MHDILHLIINKKNTWPRKIVHWEHLHVHKYNFSKYREIYIYIYIYFMVIPHYIFRVITFIFIVNL